MLFPDKKVLIVDVDGTLYNQKKLRKIMFVKMVAYYVPHFWKWKELLGIMMFRKYRYNEAYKALTIDELTTLVADKLHTEHYKIRDARHHWMDIAPLRYLPDCKYNRLIEWLNKCEQRVYIYSDYDPRVKLDALRLRCDGVFYPHNDKITTVKPNKFVMGNILDAVGVPKERILYIGDSDDKDRASASLIGVDYLDVKDVLKYV